MANPRKPNFRQFIEAQRKAKKETEATDEAIVEIFVSQPKKSTPCGNENVPVSVDMVTVISACGHKFIVPKEAACISGFIKLMLDGVCSFKEASTGVVHLPEIRAEVFEQIMGYLMQDWLFNSNATSQRTVFSVEMNEEYVMELVLACHFLDLPDLMETTCKMLADNIDRLSTLSIFPPEVVTQIYEHTTPKELIQLESVTNGPLNTLDGILAPQKVWEMKYQAKGWHTDRDSYLRSFIPACSATLPPFTSPIACFPDIFSFLTLKEQPNEINWKQEFMQRELQTILLNTVLHSSNFTSFTEEIKIYSTNVKMIKLGGSVLQSLSCVGEFLELFPCLEHIDISNCSVDEDILERILNAIPKHAKGLKSLVLRCVGASDRSLRNICSLLKVFPLLSLDITENYFTHSGIVRLGKTLRENSSLRCLTINSNQNRLDQLTVHPSRLPHWQQKEIRKRREQEQELRTIESNYSNDDSDDEFQCEHAIEALFQCLGTNDTLELLDIGYNEIVLAEISENSWVSLKQNNSLRFLLMQATTFNCNPFDYIPTSIEYLDISRLNNIENENLFSDLFRNILRFQKLIVLDASHLEFVSDVGFSELMNFVNQLSSLETLNISRNFILSNLHVGVSHCIETHPTLKYISVSGNLLRERCQLIVDAAKRRTSKAESETYFTLDISSNEIPFEQLESLKAEQSDRLRIIVEQ